MKHIGAILIGAAVAVAVTLSVLTLRSVSDVKSAQALTSASILDMLSAEVSTHGALRADLQQPPVDNGVSPQGAYLANIRRDGVQAHAEMRHELASLYKSNVTILTLLDLYEPNATTEDFKREAGAFRAYGIAWNDRWDSLMEYFMMGGNLPASDVPLPADFLSAIEAEKTQVTK